MFSIFRPAAVWFTNIAYPGGMQICALEKRGMSEEFRSLILRSIFSRRAQRLRARLEGGVSCIFTAPASSCQTPTAHGHQARAHFDQTNSLCTLRDRHRPACYLYGRIECDVLQHRQEFCAIVQTRRIFDPVLAAHHHVTATTAAVVVGGVGYFVGNKVMS